MHSQADNRRSLVLLTFFAALLLQGCTSMASRAVKTYPATPPPSSTFPSPNAYQSDFLSLVHLASEALPLQDRYFPSQQRTNIEHQILQRLGETNCTYEVFTLSVRRYLARYNNEHATILYDPNPQTLYGYYPFRPHYVSNQLFILNLGTNYPASALDRKILSINSRPVHEVERRLASFFSAENETTKRKALEFPPHPYARPDFYRFAALVPTATNDLILTLEDHPPLVLKPAFHNVPGWQRAPVPNPITARSSHLYDYRTFPSQNLAYFQFNACFDKIAIVDGLSMLKPWLRPVARIWLTSQFLRNNPAPILRNSYDPDHPIFRDFLASAIHDINSQGITNLILDLRYNNGGEVSICYQLLYHLADSITDITEFRSNPSLMAFYQPHAYKKFRNAYRRKHHSDPPSGELLELDATDRPSPATIQDQKSHYYIPATRPVFSGRVVVLVNHRTRSAASFLAGLLQDNRRALIVGTTTGNNPTGPTGLTMFKLPHTRLLISLPGGFDRRADPSKGEVLVPDHWVEPTTSDITSGNDPVFNKAVELLLGNLAGAARSETPAKVIAAPTS